MFGGRPGMGGPGMGRGGMGGQGMGRQGMGGQGMGGQGMGMGRPMGGQGMGGQGMGMGRPMGGQGMGMGRPMGGQGMGMGRPGMGRGRRYNVQMNMWRPGMQNKNQEVAQQVEKKLREQHLWQTDLDRFYREKGGDRCVRSTLTGNKKALFIGINYKGTSAELRGCINDVKNVSALVCQRYGFQNCLYLTDEQQDPTKKPTYDNIINAMKWLVQGAKSGDSLFFHYSGHGGTASDNGDSDETDGFDETILPLDFQTAGQIIDDVIYENLVTPLPQGCRLTAIFDSCHSGTVLDLPYTYQCDGQVEVIENDVRKQVFKKALTIVGSLMTGDKASIATSILSIFDGSIDFGQLLGGKPAQSGASGNQTAINKRKHDADVIQFSGCRDNQTSADAKINNEATGAMSYALITVLGQNPKISYSQLLTQIRQVMKQKNFSQIPQLSTSHPMNMNEEFSM